MKIATGLILAFAIGVLCRLSGVPVPAPPAVVGALLVLAMTIGYLVSGQFVRRQPDKHKHYCGGPAEAPPGNQG